VAANAAARLAWGLPAGDDGALLVLDRAMPALARLPLAALSTGGETLTFWTRRGLLNLRGRVEAIASEPGRYLVTAHPEEAGPIPGPSAQCGDAPTPALARLAHELRTPLGAAIAYAELLKDEHLGPLGSARYREYARNIYDSARLALSVVDGMLAPMLERGGSGDLPELAFRDLDPAGVIDTCMAVARPLAERAGLDLAARYDLGTPHVIADEVSLKQMLLNLITNAIKHARPGDGITLAAAYDADGGLRLEVADTGPGMVAAGESATASPVGRGGIGLPLTRALAAANGATLIVDSAPGRGTRVTIAFGKDRVVPK
jgi:two-component system cell cycle sensor histidine kinase PleC